MRKTLLVFNALRNLIPNEVRSLITFCRDSGMSWLDHIPPIWYFRSLNLICLIIVDRITTITTIWKLS